jgi:lipopolysaccharide transport system permease protein
MARHEIINQYIGSFLGLVWTVIHPIVIISVFWVVFSIGFKAQPMNNVPFVVWLTAGMAIWNLFSEIINKSAWSVINNAHLIKRTTFPSQILPFIKIISSTFTHIVFLIILFVLIWFQGMSFSWFYFQAVYYLFAMAILSLGLGWIVSSLNVFLRDIGQLVSVIIQIGFWATPVFWDLSMMPKNFHIYFKLNPAYYLVQGYRDSFIYFVPFWHHPFSTLYFWTFTLITFFAGAVIFQKLKPHFADIL